MSSAVRSCRIACLGRDHSYEVACSDLNPTENLWRILKVKFHERFTDLRCSLSKSEDAIEKYGEILKEVWSEINPTVLSNLIRSMPGRVQAVIKAKGGAIKY